MIYHPCYNNYTNGNGNGNGCLRQRGRRGAPIVLPFTVQQQRQRVIESNAQGYAVGDNGNHIQGKVGARNVRVDRSYMMTISIMFQSDPKIRVSPRQSRRADGIISNVYYTAADVPWNIVYRIDDIDVPDCCSCHTVLRHDNGNSNGV
jgi:hypothetical protein